MKPIHPLFLITSLLASFLIGCQKDMNESGLENSAGAAQNQALQSNRLSYGDSLFFLKNQPGNYTILPVSKPSGQGVFKAIPDGLVMDSVTGQVNITQSETGLRYKIYYVSPTGALLDSVRIVISGIDYEDAIYQINATPSAYDTAFPVYNARKELVLPCNDDDDDDDDDDNNGCIFDETDLNNDGNDDIQGVNQDKLLVDRKIGTIDLEASFHAGLFGTSTPQNGVNKTFTFYYRIQDASNRALNKISVRIYHFKKKSDIPQTLLDTLATRRNTGFEVNAQLNPTQDGGTTLSRANTPRGDNSPEKEMLGTSGLLGFQTKPKRPPIIIIVSQ